MHFKVSLFGKIFAATFDRAKEESFRRSNAVFIRLMNLQPILPCESQRAEPALEETWTVPSNLIGRYYLIVFEHLLMIRLNFEKFC